MKLLIPVAFLLVCAACAVAQENTGAGTGPLNGTNGPDGLAGTSETDAEQAPAPTLEDLNRLIKSRDNYIFLLEDRIEKLEQQVAEYGDLHERLAVLQNRFDELSDGRGLANKVFGAVPTDQGARRQFQDAAQGKIKLVNDTGAETPLYINGNLWTVRENESYIYAPVGRVSFQKTANCPPDFRNDWTYENGVQQLTYRIYK